jgi:carbon storage regulator
VTPILVLSRNVGERIVIDGSIIVSVLRVCGARVSIGIQADRSIPVNREEIEHALPEQKKHDNPAEVT